nr:hypothetical protein CFP56_04023 [Quercus suber]
MDNGSASFESEQFQGQQKCWTTGAAASEALLCGNKISAAGPAIATCQALSLLSSKSAEVCSVSGIVLALNARGIAR